MYGSMLKQNIFEYLTYILQHLPFSALFPQPDIAQGGITAHNTLQEIKKSCLILL